MLDDGALLVPGKVALMLRAYAANPDAGFVMSAQLPLSADGVPGDAAPLLAGDAIVAGPALGEMILRHQHNMLGSLAAALLRRADAEAALAQFGGRRYSALAAPATWLGLLSERGVVYFHATHSTQRAAPAPAAADTGAITAAVEWLQLLLDARKLRRYAPVGEDYHALLAQRLADFVRDTASQHLLLRAARYPVEEIQQVLRLGYQSLVDDGIDAVALALATAPATV